MHAWCSHKDAQFITVLALTSSDHFYILSREKLLECVEHKRIHNNKSHYGGGSGNDCLVMFLDCFVLILFFQGYFKIF